MNTTNAKEAPAYAPEFLATMADYALAQLRAYLEAEGVDQVALELLDDMVIVKDCEGRMQAEQVEPLYNKAAAEAVAAISQNVAELGGVFYGPDTAAMLFSLAKTHAKQSV